MDRPQHKHCLWDLLFFFFFFLFTRGDFAIFPWISYSSLEMLELSCAYEAGHCFLGLAKTTFFFWL